MPSKDLIEAEGTLRTVIETLIDGQEGFQKIGDALEDESLKRYFLAESLTRAEFRGELENILHQEGVGDIHETGSAAGAFVRAWTSLKIGLGGGAPTLLEAAEEAEDAAKQAYADALDKFLPAPIREVLIRQAAHIERAHDHIKAARDASR
ncbi:MAG TPA: PA2169 family four-helix-bundle protein [Terracidiphilus sp.]